jgi:hypothetical protein
MPSAKRISGCAASTSDYPFLSSVDRCYTAGHSDYPIKSSKTINRYYKASSHQTFELQQVQLAGPGHGSGAVADSELAVDVLHMFLDGAHRDDQPVGNLAVRQARRDKV